MLPVDALATYLLVFNIYICKITFHDSLIHHITRITVAISLIWLVALLYIVDSIRKNFFKINFLKGSKEMKNIISWWIIFKT